MAYRIDPALPLDEEVRRIAEEEIAAALAALDRSRTQPGKGIHNVRKRLKRLRALLLLVRTGDEAFWRAQNARYRAIARGLAEAREAAALVETVDRLIEARQKREATPALSLLRSELERRRTEEAHAPARFLPVLDAASDSLRRGRTALPGLRLPGEAETAADILAAGAQAALAKAAAALEKAIARGHEEDFHDLRKAVKAHGMHLQLLYAFWPKASRSRAREVADLGECLGELTDLFVLRALVQSGNLGLHKHQVSALLRLIGRSEAELRKKCLKEAPRLLAVPAKRTARKVAERYRARAGAEPADNSG